MAEQVQLEDSDGKTATMLHYGEKFPRNRLTTFGFWVASAIAFPGFLLFAVTCFVRPAGTFFSYWYPGIAFVAAGFAVFFKVVVETWQTRRPILTRATPGFYFEKSPKAYVIMLVAYGCFAALLLFAGAVAILDAIRAG